MLNKENITEFVLDELARTFRKMLSAKAYSENIVEVDFSKLPERWRFAIPVSIGVATYTDPTTVNGLDLIKNTLPGLWGYAKNAGLENLNICTCCGKDHNHKD